MTQAELASAVNRFIFSFLMQFSEENNVSHAYVEEKIVNKAFMNPLRAPNVSGMLFQASNNYVILITRA